MGFNRLKGLLYIVSGMNVFSQLNYFSIDWFHLSQVKSTDCTENSIEFFSLKPDYISCVFASRGANLSFCAWNFVILLWKALSTIHSCSSCFKDLGWSWRHFGLWVAWRTHVWLVRDNHHHVWMFLCLWLVCLMWLQVCKCDSCRVCV